MPRLDDDTEAHTINGNFSFTGRRIEKLTATEYTLVDIEVDMSSSVDGFQKDLINCIGTAIDACRKSPRSDNLLVRVAAFSTRYPRGAGEVHGYKLLSEIDVKDYASLTPGGSTPLCDACYLSVGAMNAYAKTMAASDFLVNGISFIITDGEENASSASMDMVRAEIEKAKRDEHLESHISVLIGINAAHCASSLTAFQNGVGITQFIDAGQATKGNLAKLAAFVSQSISSQSQSVGTGGPSQNIAATI